MEKTMTQPLLTRRYHYANISRVTRSSLRKPASPSIPEPRTNSSPVFSIRYRHSLNPFNFNQIQKRGGEGGQKANPRRNPGRHRPTYGVRLVLSHPEQGEG